MPGNGAPDAYAPTLDHDALRARCTNTSRTSPQVIDGRQLGLRVPGPNGWTHVTYDKIGQEQPFRGWCQVREDPAR